MSALHKLFARYVPTMSPGTLNWIGLRPARKAPMIVVETANALEGLGLEGDRRCEATPGSARQVTIINQEHIEVIEKLLNIDFIDPSLLRRNLVVSGINLQALRHQYFQIGDVIFEATAQCHPCRRMEQNLGVGGAAAVLGHGGICAKIIKGGKISVGDQILPVLKEDPSN